jgi:PPE family
MTARWRGYEHRELYEMINTGPGPGASDQQTHYWSSLTAELELIDSDLGKALAEINATWEGAASESAQAGMTPLQAWASDAQIGTAVMRISTENQAEYVSTARAEMPQPVTVTTPAPSAWDVGLAGLATLTGNPGPAVAVAVQAIDHEIQEAAQDAAAQKAVDTMNVYQQNSTWNADTLGTFVPPPDIVVSTPLPPGATGGPVGGWALESAQAGGITGTTTSGFTAPGPSGGTGGALALPGGGGGGTGYPSPGGGGGYLAPAPLPSGSASSTSPSGSIPAGTAPRPPGSTLPSPANPSPGYPPGTAPPGGSGAYAVPPGGSGPGSGAGSSIPGSKPGTGTGTGLRGGGLPGVGGVGGLDADGSRANAQLGRGGAIGEGIAARGGPASVAGGGRGGAAGGPMVAGARGQGEDDDEHFSPDYLLETADVFGDSRMVSPAVIGESPDPAEK